MNQKEMTTVDRWIQKLKNNQLIAAFIILAIVISGITTFWESINKVSNFLQDDSKNTELVAIKEPTYEREKKENFPNSAPAAVETNKETGSVETSDLSLNECLKESLKNTNGLCASFNQRSIDVFRNYLKRKNVSQQNLQTETTRWIEKYNWLKISIDSDFTGRYAKQVRALFEAGNVEGANKIIDESLLKADRRFGNTADQHFTQAILYWIQGKEISALQHFGESYEIWPDYHVGFSYASMLLAMKQLDQAESVYLAIRTQLSNEGLNNRHCHDYYQLIVSQGLHEIYIAQKHVELANRERVKRDTFQQNLESSENVTNCYNPLFSM